MQILIIVVIALHVVTGVYWAGSTFVQARLGDAAPPLFGSQMRAATVAVVAGLILWGLLHRGAFGPMEITLSVGVICAIAAAGVQGALHRKAPVRSQRIAAGLLAITVICMVIARYVG
jgi:hypothetical protein